MTYQDFGSRVIIAEPDDPPDRPPRRRKCSVCGNRRRCVDRYLDGEEWTCVPCLRAAAAKADRRNAWQDQAQREWEAWQQANPGEAGLAF